MATLEDAAQDLVVKLRGLDSEIEESERKLEELRGRIDGTSGDVEQEWTALTEAVSCFLERVREEQERLDQGMRDAVQAVGESRQAVAEAGAEARTEIAEGRSRLDALTQHAAGLEPTIESLLAEAGEAPARSLAERAAEIKTELTRLMEEARDFLRDEVLAGLQDVADEVRQRCQTLRTTLAEEHTSALRAAFDDWESQVDELEDYVADEGFLASQEHAQGVVEDVLGDCQAACEPPLDELGLETEVVAGQVEELALEAGRSGASLVAQFGADLSAGLDGTREAVASALSALGLVRELLAGYRFVEM